MRYALNIDKDKIEVNFSGELAKCGNCNSNVKGRKGEQRIKHWYHHKKKTIDCDNWYEPISEWHLKWQDLFPKKNREVTIKENDISHRADILLDNGLVIEVQNSPIKFSEIEKRERFYGKNNLIWILNGNNLTTKSMLTEDVFNYSYMMSISVPKTFSLAKNYKVEELIDNILKEPEIGRLKSDRNIFKIKNGNVITFKFIDDKFNDFNLIQVQFRYYVACVYTNLYSQNGLNQFRERIEVKYKIIDETVSELRLVKKYWKRFIDKMKFPVFIDNLNGIKENELYYYSKNKIISKDKFINYYLKYT